MLCRTVTVGRKLVGVVEKQFARELSRLVAGLDDVETKQLAALVSRVVGVTDGIYEHARRTGHAKG